DGDWAAAVLTELVRVRSITGDEGAVQDLVASRLGEAGCWCERIEAAPAVPRADPDWPGDEMPRARLPIVLGRLGKAGGRRIVLVGAFDMGAERGAQAYTPHQ